MTLQHIFFIGNTPKQGFWSEKVFKNVYSLNDLERNLQKLAFPKDSSDLNGHDPLSKILGDGWEAFGEIFFTVFGLHPDIKVYNLKICPPGQQGYDYTFTHAKNLLPSTIQAKYIGKNSAWQEILKENENMKLERFLKASQNEANVPVDATDNMIIFTNAADIDYWTSGKLLYNKVRFIGRKHILYLTENNPAFWDTARAMIKTTNKYVSF
jgi:hypothetical protein